MKAILEFDLDDPHQKSEHNLCCDAIDLYLKLWKIDKILSDKDNLTSGGMLNEIYSTLQEIDWNRYPD